MFKEDVAKSLESTITLLCDVICRLELKGKKGEIYEGSSSAEIQEFWEVLQLIEPLLTREDTRKKHVSDKEGLKAFYEHCCVTLHYFFSIKKCGEEGCKMCKPVRMPKDEFQKIKHLPDPMLGEKDHYLPFCDAFKTKTSESDRPSLAKTDKRPKPLPFSASVQHIKNRSHVTV